MVVKKLQLSARYSTVRKSQEQPMVEEQTKVLNAARDIYAVRKRRKQFLPPELFGEPGWDMLLDLFIAHLERRARSLDAVCGASGVATGVAMRWVAILEARGLVVHHGGELTLTRGGLAHMSTTLSF
jgi:predicted Rossmann fold nucleotide-binding protein DprA/Smf involved in DNA uptake